MIYQSFKEWLTYKDDIFGFERKAKNKKSFTSPEDDGPVKMLECGKIVRELMQHKIGLKTPNLDFPEQITWGNINLGEALRIDFSPLGSLRLTTKRYITDLEGTETWICKHVLLLPEGKEEEITESVLNELEKIDQTGIDSAARNYNLENLVLKLIGEIKSTRPCQWMMLDKTKQVNKNHYITSLNMTGYGIGSSSGSGLSERIVKYEIHTIFEENRGLIRSFGNNVSAKHWLPDTPDWDEYFAPSQKKDEIIECIIRSLKSY